MTRYVDTFSYHSLHHERLPGIEANSKLQLCVLRENAHQKKNFVPVGMTDTLARGTYYLAEVDELFRRRYEIKV